MEKQKLRFKILRSIWGLIPWLMVAAIVTFVVLMGGQLKEKKAALAKAKKEAIKKEWVGSSSLLETALSDVFTTNDKITNAEQKFVNGVEKKCAALQDPAATFPGACANPDLGVVEECVIAAARCQACLMVNASDGLNLDCDAADDGDADGSCP